MVVSPDPALGIQATLTVVFVRFSDERVAATMPSVRHASFGLNAEDQRNIRAA
jgi:hypothetical protein